MDRNRMIECEKLYTISDWPLSVRKHTQVFIEFRLGLERVVNILNIKTEINGCLQISISAQ